MNEQKFYPFFDDHYLSLYLYKLYAKIDSGINNRNTQDNKSSIFTTSIIYNY